jgi:hypothetical protein
VRLEEEDDQAIPAAIVKSRGKNSMFICDESNSETVQALTESVLVSGPLHNPEEHVAEHIIH